MSYCLCKDDKGNRCENECEGLQCGLDSCARWGKVSVDSGSSEGKARVASNSAVSGGVRQVEGPVEVTLPWDALVSKNDRQNPHSGFGITRKWRQGLKRCRELAQMQYTGEPLDGDVRVAFTFYPPSRRPDLPNYLALPLDALQGVAYHNDRQANAGGEWKWGYIDKLEPRVEIRVRAITSSEGAA